MISILSYLDKNNNGGCVMEYFHEHFRMFQTCISFEQNLLNKIKMISKTFLILYQFHNENEKIFLVNQGSVIKTKKNMFFICLSPHYYFLVKSNLK